MHHADPAAPARALSHADRDPTPRAPHRWAALPPAPFLCIAAAFVLMLSVMVLLGLTHPWISPDTASFRDACAEGGCWGGARTPFYGWMLSALGTSAIVGMQFGATLLGAFVLCAGVRDAGGSDATATAAGLAVVCSTVTLLWTRALLPEAFAHAALLCACGAMLSRRPLVAGLLTAAACSLKPALLPFAILVPAMQLILLGRRHLLVIGLACLLPLLGLAAWRKLAVGDLNIVSFGGFQMSGIAALMLTPELAHRLPASLQQLALDILHRRAVLVAAGVALPIPFDSNGARSFFATALGYGDILARTFDPVLYGAVRPARLPAESWVAFNARMQHLTLAVIRLDPLGYAAWVMGGLARVAGRIALFNPLFLVSIAACVVLRGWSVGARRDRFIAATLCGAWLLGTVAPVVALSFPAGRYIDSAGLMLPLLPLCCVMHRLAMRRKNARLNRHS